MAVGLCNIFLGWTDLVSFKKGTSGILVNG
jgi:hypothetical protein